MISFDPLFAYMEKHGKSIYHLTRDNIVSNQTLVNMRLHPDKGISTKTINKICNYLQCKPKDVFSYSPDKVDPGNE